MSDGYQIKDQLALYFLTFQVVFWIDLFSRAKYRDILIESMQFCRHEKGLEIYSYVIMSNHMHIICRSLKVNLSDTIRDFKKFTSYRILEEISNIETGESRKEWMLDKFAFAARINSRNTSYQIWTHENHAVELCDKNMIDDRINYIHDNPVRAKIVEYPYDYLYSSARNYSEMDALMEIDFI